MARSLDTGAFASVLAGLGELPGVGVDVELVARFAVPDTRLFTLEELAYCDSQEFPAESRAGRWCAKEAVAKACSRFLQLSLREVEILAGPSGRPQVRLSARALAVGLLVDVSISHAGGMALAVAFAAQERGARRADAHDPGEAIK